MPKPDYTKPDVELTDGHELDDFLSKFVDNGIKVYSADGTEVPKHTLSFKLGETVYIKDQSFKVACVGEAYLVFEPLGFIEIK